MDVRKATFSLILLVIVISSGIPFVHAGTFLNKTFTLHGKISSECEYQYEYAYNSTGYVITGTVSVTGGKIELFILTQWEWNQFAGSTGCNQGFSASELSAVITNSYSVNYKVPDNANHYFVFYNLFWQDAIVTVNLTW